MNLFHSLGALVTGRYSSTYKKKTVARHKYIRGRSDGLTCGNCGTSGSHRGNGVACNQCLSTKLC